MKKLINSRGKQEDKEECERISVRIQNQTLQRSQKGLPSHHKEEDK